MINRSDILCKTLTLSVILLFVGISVQPCIAITQDDSILLSNGNTLYVGGSGPGNYTSIQDAIDNAGDGDTVFVYDDSSPYYENIWINKTIKLYGEDKNSTIIDGQKIYLKDVICIKGGNSIVSGFTIKNSHKTSSGIGIKSDNNVISDCNLIDNGLFGGVFIGEGGMNNNLITNCYFKSNDNTGIKIIGWDEGASNNIISHCTFEETRIDLWESPNTLITNCTLTGGYAEIQINHDSENCQIINCTIDSVPYGISIESNFVLIENCIVSNCKYNGITFSSYVETISIFNCTVLNCDVGIRLSQSWKSVISGCRLMNNINGIKIHGYFLKTEISNCNFVDNEYGLQLHYSNYFNRFYHNNFINKKGDFELIYDFVFMFNFFDENYWSGWKGILPIYHVFGWVNWDFNPAQEPYDMDV